MFQPKMKAVGYWKHLRTVKLHELQSSPNIILWWNQEGGEGGDTHEDGEKYIGGFRWGKNEVKNPLGKLRRMWVQTTQI